MYQERLIFERFPKSKTSTGEPVWDDFVREGRSVTYRELPDRLWATTGIRIEHAKDFIRFGELRNRIVHVAWSGPDASCEVLRFVFGVVEPMTLKFWGRSVLPFAQHWDDVVAEGYLQRQLIRAEAHVPSLTRAKLLWEGGEIEITSATRAQLRDDKHDDVELSAGTTLRVAGLPASHLDGGAVLSAGGPDAPVVWMRHEHIASAAKVIAMAGQGSLVGSRRPVPVPGRSTAPL